MRTFLKQLIISLAVFLLAAGAIFSPAGAAFADQLPDSDTRFELELESKKGLQGDYILTESGVTGSHMLLNLYLDLLMSPVATDCVQVVENESFYFNPVVLSAYQYRLKQAKERNIRVTFVVLMRGNSFCASKGMMAAGADAVQPGRLYALNPDSRAVEAAFRFLARRFSSGSESAANWILGNEVNMPDAWNYTGTKDAEKNVDLYAKTFVRFRDALTNEGNHTTRAFISLDHSWMDDGDGEGIPGRLFLALFIGKIRDYSPDPTFHIAYHLYAPELKKTSSIWKEPELAAQNVDTPFICPSNLSVLTEYVKENVGPNTRILLSEQGYDIGEGETVQAAGLALCYYAALKEEMVEAVLFRSYKDEGTDGGLDLGLVNKDGTPREAFDVYQKMDTKRGLYVLAKYLTKINYEWS